MVIKVIGFLSLTVALFICVNAEAHGRFHHRHSFRPLHHYAAHRHATAEVAPGAAGGREAGTGLASWYRGRGGLTAAHRSMPFGTRVLVTNRNNGRNVVVLINDRGPFIRGRVIDLNRSAALAIGMTGVSPVSLRRL